MMICHSIDRMTRNLDNLREAVLRFTTLTIHVCFEKESLTSVGEDSQYIAPTTECHGSICAV